MKQQNSDLSALYDGELDAHESRAVVSAVLRSAEARSDWQAYALIGDHLRQEGHASGDLTAAVMARLREEPVVLAPQSLKLTSQRHPLWALAASVAGVAVVGWLALAGTPGDESRMASVSPASTMTLVASRSSVPAMATPAENTVARRDMQEYLLAHHTQAATFRFGDSVDHVRSVAMTGPANRP